MGEPGRLSHPPAVANDTELHETMSVTDHAVEAPSAAAVRVPAVVTRAISGLALMAELLILAALLFDLGLTFTATLLRYFVGGSIVWFGDAISITLNTIAFLGAAAAYRRVTFLSFTYVQERCPPRIARTLSAFAVWLTLVTAATVLYEWPGFFRATRSATFVYLHLSEAWAGIWMGIGLVLIVVFAVEKLVRFDGLTLAASLALALCGAGLIYLWRHFDPNDIATWKPLIPVLFATLVGLVAGASIPYVLTLGGLTYFFVTGSTGIIGIPSTMQAGISNFILLAIPFFVLAGVLMEVTGMSVKLVELVEACIGRVRGGLLQTEVVGVYAFSGLSGSKAADMAAVGGALKGPLKARGYPEEEAVAVLAASAVMGVTVPPSINLIIVGSITAVSMSSLFIAGFIPAAVLALSLMVAIAVRARLHDMPRGARFRLRTVAGRVPGALPALLLPLILIGGIAGGVGTATEVSSFAVVYGFVITLIFYRAVGARSMVQLVRDACVVSGLILFLLSGASVFTQAIVRLNVPQLLTDLFTSTGSKVGFLALSAVGLIIVGSLLEGLPAMYIFAPILIPIAATLGVDPLQFAIVLVMAIEMGAFLPPLGAGLYIACALMDVPPARVVRPLLVYWAILLVGLALVIAVPWFSLVLPHAFGFH